MNLLRTGSEWLTGKRHAAMSDSVTYSRGVTTATVQATAGETRSEEIDQSGAVIQTRAKDWLIRAEDIATFAPPTPGDRITDQDGGIYEVMSLGAEGPWRWADEPVENVYRIHTKRVGTV